MTSEGTATVGPGATGDTVSQTQRALRRTPNTALVVDGKFGPGTEAATRDFQAAEGLPVTGVVDAATWKALPDGNAMPTLRQGSKGDVVRSLQQVLTSGASDGVVGRRTWTASPLALEFVVGIQHAAGE